MTILSRDFNPFANIELNIPKAYAEEVKRFSRAGDAETRGDPGAVPFNRMVDLWFLAVCVGAAEDAFMSLPKGSTHKFHTGQVLQGDILRIEFLLLNAIAHTGDPYIVNDPKQVIAIAEGCVAGGLPYLIDMLSVGHSSPALNLTRAISAKLQDQLSLEAK